MASLPKLQTRLILPAFFAQQFGFDGPDALRDHLRPVGEGLAPDGYSRYYHALHSLQGLDGELRLALTRYDQNIRAHLARLNEARQPAIQLRYFQYLALLFAELHLNRLFNARAQLLRELNEWVEQQNKALPRKAWPYPTFSEDDLSKVALWMATGSGKTLLMHINLWQYLHYAPQPPNNILLITPYEGLSQQHLAEFARSGILAQRYGERESLLHHGHQAVKVIEITKLTESKRGGGLSVEVDTFGSNNLLLVDEGHRGASGDVWRELRARVAQEGFTWEYSATFGQTVNGATRSRREDLLTEYVRAILFDYAYPHFYEDGYGKEYWIVNIKEKSERFSQWMILGNLIGFYEQMLVWERHGRDFRAYGIEQPLWVFVGHSVTGRATTNDDRTSLTDVEQVVAFFDDFLRDREAWVARIEQVRQNQSGLRTPDGRELWEPLFGYLRQQEAQRSAEELYDDIVRRVFHAHPGETLRLAELTQASGEIGMRVGADNAYFGVVYIGDVAGLMKLFAGRDLHTEKDVQHPSLFHSIKAADSDVTVLLGSRKFTEGWDTYRVASMGLMNIGRGEGSQIIQLFGRGVRLRGKGQSLKRSSALLEEALPPPHIETLETLNIFGVRANYMAQFREYLSQENIVTQLEELTVPIVVEPTYLDQELQLPHLPDGLLFNQMPLVLRPDDGLHIKLDQRPKFETASSEEGAIQSEALAASNQIEALRQLAPLLDWEQLYFGVLALRAAKGMPNLSLSPDTLRRILAEGKLQLILPAGYLDGDRMFSMARLKEATALAQMLLNDYTAKFYEKARQAWEQEHLRLVPLTAQHPNLARGSYTVQVEPEWLSLMRALVGELEHLQQEDEERYPLVYFARHLYQPLLMDKKETHKLHKVSPAGLNEGEIRLVRDLRDYLQTYAALFEGKQFYLLRNLSRYGVGFFDAQSGKNFYPDFVLWIVEGETQWIIFIDPHGLRNERWDSRRILLHQELRDEHEPRLREQSGRDVHLTSFIISPNAYNTLSESWVADHSKEAFEARQVLFQDARNDYIERLLGRVRELWEGGIVGEARRAEAD